jgi:hypothetical protein
MINQEEIKIQAEQKPEIQEGQEARADFESPEEILAESEKEVEGLRQEGQQRLALFETRAAAEGLVIEEGDKTDFEILNQEADQIREALAQTIKGAEQTEVKNSSVEVNLYKINLSQEEIELVVDGFVNDSSGKGQHVDPEKINILRDLLKKGEEECEDLIASHPQYFQAERLAELAKNNPDLALRNVDLVKSGPDKASRNLIGILAERKEFEQLLGVLDHYKINEARFDLAVKEIERVLSGKNMILLSNAMKKAPDYAETIAEHESAMKKEKHTARPLEEYEKALQIDQQSLEQLNNEQLLIVGGGFSPVKKALKEKGIECTVTNIDPIAKEDTNIADTIISKDFFEIPVEEGKYKEVWALHSLPTYAFNPEQVKDFYSRSVLALKENGILRVAPIDKFSDSFSPSMRLSRKSVNEASVEFISKLGQRPDLFELVQFSIEKKKNKMSPVGKKSEMPGVNIRIIGGKKQIKDFLKNYQ